MSNHTPGPWKARYGRVYRSFHGEYPAGNFYLLSADREPTDDYGTSNPTPPTERDANIRLAAKAPELLDMLQTLLSLLVDHIQDDAYRANTTPEKSCSCTEGGIAAARKLIASVNA